MLENCDYLDKRKMSVRKPKRRKRVKRSEPSSDGQQRDKDRDFLKPRSMMILDHNLELEKSKQAGSIIIFKMTGLEEGERGSSTGA